MHVFKSSSQLNRQQGEKSRDQNLGQNKCWPGVHTIESQASHNKKEWKKKKEKKKGKKNVLIF